MVFLNPLFLWALLGISIPIAIHFWSKKKVRTIKIGSTQFLKELNPKQTSSIRFNQWFLLLLRVMILGLITLILAAPRLELKENERSITYLVEPSLLTSDKVKPFLDTLAKDQVRLLQTGFPLKDETVDKIPANIIPNYWQLSQEMKNLRADSIIVLSKGLKQGFKGMRPSVNLPIHWLVIDTERSKFSPLVASQIKDQFVVTSIKSNQTILEYFSEIYELDNGIIETNNQGDSIKIRIDKQTTNLPLTVQQTSRILITSDAQFSAEEIYISSAFNALSKYLSQDIQISSMRDVQGVDLSSFDVLVWLKQATVVPFSGKKLQWREDDLAASLIEAGTSPDQYFLTAHLDTENSVDKNLPIQLMALLDSGQQLPEHINSFDLRTMDVQEMQVNMKSGQTFKKPMQLKDISAWLWALLLFVLPVERILSKYKNQ